MEVKVEMGGEVGTGLEECGGSWKRTVGGRDSQAGRLSMWGRGEGWEGATRVGLMEEGGRRWMGKVVLSCRARNVLEQQSMRPWTAWQKGQPRMVSTETSSPRAMERWTGEPSVKV